MKTVTHIDKRLYAAYSIRIDAYLCEVNFVNEICVVSVCRALGDDNRLKIVKLLSNGTMCGCKLLDALNITQPTLSHHMKILCDNGLVTAKKEGKRTHYTLCCTRLEEFKNCISALKCKQKENG